MLVAVEALLYRGELTVTSLGRSIRSRVAPKHNIKRIDRLLSNPILHREMDTWYRALAMSLASGVSRLIVLMDWTDIGRCCALVAAVPIAGRAIPIYGEVHPKSKYGNRRLQCAFLQTLKRILPRNACPIVVSDAGFKDPFFSAVHELGWGFVGRIRGSNRKFGYLQHSYRQILGTAKSQPTDLGDWQPRYPRKSIWRLVLGAKRKKSFQIRPKQRLNGNTAEARRRAHEPWLLATNLWRHSPKEIVGIYAMRMRIEEAFRDIKSSRYGWSFEQTRTHRAERLSVMLLLATLATLAAVLVGLAASQQGITRRLQANTIRHRAVLSLFTVGRLSIDSQSVVLTQTLCTQLLRLLRTQLSREVRNTDNGAIDRWLYHSNCWRLRMKGRWKILV
jgi:hypothetical protein